MTSNPMSQCCLMGTLHEGDTKGKQIKISNDTIDAYLATPPEGKAKDGRAILYLPDVYGIWKNSQLMADNFAENGYTVLIPDIFRGDPVPWDKPEGFNLMEWLTKGTDGKHPHTAPHVDPLVEAGCKALKEMGFHHIGSVGYCFGAKYLLRHHKNGISVGFIAHPSFVEDSEVRGFNGPLSIAAAQHDNIFPAPKRQQTEKLLSEGKTTWQMTLFSGVEHGFSVRGDMNVKVEKFAKEAAFRQAVNWFDEHLG